MRTLTADTEFVPDTKQITWVGLKFDGGPVYGFPLDWQYLAPLKQACEDSSFRKVLQNGLADMRVLENVGIGVAEPVWDTMIAAYVLYPGLEVGLNDIARFYLDDPPAWWLAIKAGRKRGEGHTKEEEARYNAADVAVTHDVYQAQLKECASRPVSPLPEIEARCRLIPVIKRMEEVGMRVDVATQRALIKRLRADIEATERQIDEKVKGLWQGRVDSAAMDYAVKDNWAAILKQQGVGQCGKHPTFNGLRKAKTCPTCHLIYDQTSELRTKYQAAMKLKGKAKGKVARWQEGFKWGSPEHLGWLLYDALGIPEQLNRKTGRRITDAKTIDDLATKIEGARTGGKARSKYHVSEESWHVIEQIKETQGWAKAISTFLDLPLSEDGYLKWPHLSYKINGTTTGRLAGGEEKGGDEDKLRAEGHSLMNIPKEWRRIYIPPPHHVFINADFVNQEGNAYAWLTQDVAYLEMLQEERRGGHKVHALTAALIYGIDPADAKRVKVTYKGVEISAYDGGKRARHAWSYAYLPVGMLIGNYGMGLAEAVRVVELLDMAHPEVKAYKERTVKTILGEWAVDVGRTGQPRAALIKPGRKWMANPFGWQFCFNGAGKIITNPVTGKKAAVPIQANEVLAFGPQSIGASIWARLARQMQDAGLSIQVGNYDSFLCACAADPLIVRQTVDMIVSLMEQPWPELAGFCFKVEASVGRNWGEADGTNPDGLREIGAIP